MMRSVVLARRPQGNPVEADFALSEAPLPAVTEGTFLTRNDFISLDAGFRNWMNEDSGDEVLPAMALNEPVMGLVLAEVIESQHVDYQVGDKLMARFSWQTHTSAMALTLSPGCPIPSNSTPALIWVCWATPACRPTLA